MSIDVLRERHAGRQELVPTVEWGPGLGSGVVASTRTYSPPPQPIFYRDGTRQPRQARPRFGKRRRRRATFGFAGVDDHYFLTAAVAGGQPRARRVSAA